MKEYKFDIKYIKMRVNLYMASFVVLPQIDRFIAAPIGIRMLLFLPILLIMLYFLYSLIRYLNYMVNKIEKFDFGQLTVHYKHISKGPLSIEESNLQVRKFTHEIRLHANKKLIGIINLNSGDNRSQWALLEKGLASEGKPT